MDLPDQRPRDGVDGGCDAPRPGRTEDDGAPDLRFAHRSRSQGSVRDIRRDFLAGRLPGVPILPLMETVAAGRPAPIDGVTTALDDEAALAADIDHAKTLGYTGKLCVHPRQVAAANRGLAPSDSENEWARDVLAHAGDGSVAVAGGQMVDKPVEARARAILDRADGPFRPAG
ncbi:hypothetical protein LCL61_04320 [Amycolatopsis coloradensis]|uniref:Uncharacterized protein n=1 Tax=Amycolatopsis coloradensis TaxID=76021 RepID=A0ACD5B604_9PSEU